MIDYFAESERFRPSELKTLLVGEAPPPSGNSYFYVPGRLTPNRPIESDTSLPSTIFNHYFRNRPSTHEEYLSYLYALKELGIFLIDICDKPIKVRNNPEGLAKITDEIQFLRKRISERNILIDERNIIFLLARNNYTAKLRQEFPLSKRVSWKEFRLNPSA